MAERLLPSGYDVAMVAPDWYAADATASGCPPFVLVQLDAHGRPQPAADRFPSAMEGCGFAPLAAQVHRLGLRFGVHLTRGIPREAVARGLPIAGSPWRCDEVANLGSTGAWNSDMCNVNLDHPGAFDWYRAWFAQLTACGVNAAMVDGSASPQGHAEEVGLMRRAIEATGRRIDLSLSPSPKFLHQGTWPELRDDIVNLLERSSQAPPDDWPCAGVLNASGDGLGKGDGAHDPRLTRDEQMLMLTAWACARRPLVLGGDLRRMDDWTLHLVTNPDVLAFLRAPGRREWQAFAEGH
ncbi:MAG: alpha-galactosidase, partial [Burkholderiales bacterium]